MLRYRSISYSQEFEGVCENTSGLLRFLLGFTKSIRGIKNMKEDLSRRTEDYLRGIHDILERRGYARIKDISKELGVQPATATEMARKLDSMGLVIYEKYGGVMLSPEGKEVAKTISERHETFRRFLEIILVPKDIALKDAHVFEHQLDPKTILQFTRFVEFISQAPEHPRFVGRWLEQFKEYCKRENAMYK